MIKNSADRYGIVAQLFHFMVAVAIIGLLALGLYMADLPGTAPNKYPLYALHKSFGIAVLILMIGRVCWKAYNSGLPLDNPLHAKWEKLLAHSVHVLLYLTAFLIPISGWVMSSADGHPVALFGLPLPALVAENKQIGGLAKEAHELLAYATIGLISLHVIGALKHQFVDRDGIFGRMFSCPCKK